MVQPESYLETSTSVGRTHKLARIISDVMNPVFVGIFAMGLLAFRNIDDPRTAWFWMSVMVLIASLPPLSYVLYLVKIGYLADIHMPDRDKRVKPVSFIFLWVLVSIFILNAFQAPPIILMLLGAVVAQVLLLWLITLVWKISFHSATITTAAIIALLVNSSSAWMMLLLVPIVGWARVHLNRHTLMQVIAGALAGTLVALVAFEFITTQLPY